MNMKTKPEKKQTKRKNRKRNERVREPQKKREKENDRRNMNKTKPEKENDRMNINKTKPEKEETKREREKKGVSEAAWLSFTNTSKGLDNAASRPPDCDAEANAKW